MGHRTGKTSFTFIPLSGIILYPTRSRVTQKTEIWPHPSLTNGGIFRHCYLAEAGNNRECHKLLQSGGFLLTLAAQNLTPKMQANDTISRAHQLVYLVIWSLTEMLCSKETSQGNEDNALLTRNIIWIMKNSRHWLLRCIYLTPKIVITAINLCLLFRHHVDYTLSFNHAKKCTE